MEILAIIIGLIVFMFIARFLFILAESDVVILLDDALGKLVHWYRIRNV